MLSCKDKKQTLRDKRIALHRWMVGTTCRMSLIALMVVFGVLYIMQTSSVSTKGFEMSDLQKQITSLEHETRALDVEIASHRSMTSIQQRLTEMELVHAGTVDYRTPVGSAVARR